MDTLVSDIRLALRALRRSGSFAVTAMLTLALGIGASTAIFSVVHGILFRPLPYPQPDRLMVLWYNNTREGIERDITSYPNFQDWRARGAVFAHMSTYRYSTFSITDGGDPEQVPAVLASIDFFSTMGVAPLLGRGFVAEEMRPGADAVTVLGYGLWQRRFGGAPDVIGRSIQLNGSSYRVIGVMPTSFAYPADAELWLPLAESEQMLASRGSLSYSVIGRLRDGVDARLAQQQMTSVASQLAEEYPATNSGGSIFVEPLRDTIVGDLRAPLLILLGAVGLVLLIGCANVANLLLARGAVRQKEFALRAALGAGGWRLSRQVLTESVVLALAGGAVGSLLAMSAVAALVGAAPADLPRVNEIGVNLPVLSFALAISLLTGLLFGLAPLAQARRAQLMGTLRAGGQDSTAAESLGRVRPALISGEVGLALVLLVGASLLIRTLVAITSVEPGFDERNVLTFRVGLPAARYAAGDPVTNFHRALHERVKVLPGVSGVGAISTLFLSRLPNMAPITLEGAPPRDASDAVESVPYDAVSAGFFDAMRIPLVRGRQFVGSDRTGGPPVVIVNEAFVRRYFPDGDALGRRFTFGDGSGDDGQWLSIVGIVADARRSGLVQPPRPEAYFPHDQFQARTLTYVVRTSGDPLAVVGSLRSAVKELDARLPLSQLQTLEETLAEQLAARRFIMVLLSGFAALALVLASIGIYGVVAYLVTQRTRELGIRLALGANPAGVVRLIVVQSLRSVLPGVVLGTAVALVLARVMRSQLFGVAPTDALTYVGAGIALTAVCVLASLVPAARAARTDPMRALRVE